MTTLSVMEMADDIMSSMGISDAVPLSEAPVEAVHSIGKVYSQDLPYMTDEQRSQLIAESVPIAEKKGPGASKKETAEVASMSPGEVHGELQVKQPRKRKKKLKRKEFEFEITTESKKKPEKTKKTLEKKYKELINRKPNLWSPQARTGQSITTQAEIARLAKQLGQTEEEPKTENRKPFQGLGEMTTVGCIGVGPFANKPAQDPGNPFKKKKRKITSDFIKRAFMK